MYDFKSNTSITNVYLVQRINCQGETDKRRYQTFLAYHFHRQTMITLHGTVKSTILFWYPQTKVELPWGDCNGESKPVEQVEDRRGTLRRLFEGVEAAMHDMLLSETDTTRLCVAWLVEVQDTSESRVSLVSSAVSTDDVTTSLNWTLASKLVDLVTLLWPFCLPLDFELNGGDARVVEFVPRVVSDAVRSGPTISQMTEAEFSVGPSSILR